MLNSEIIISATTLTLARVTKHRIGTLVAIEAIPCTLEEFLKYEGTMVNHTRALFANAKWDDKGRLEQYTKYRSGGVHEIFHEDDGTIRVENDEGFWTIDALGEIVEQGNAFTYRQNSPSLLPHLNKSVVKDTKTNKVIYKTSNELEKGDNFIKARDMKMFPDGRVSYPPEYSIYVKESDTEMITYYSNDIVKTCLVKVKGKSVYYHTVGRGKKPGFTETFTFDASGKLLSFATPTRITFYSYTTFHGQITQIKSQTTSIDAERCGRTIEFRRIV